MNFEKQTIEQRVASVAETLDIITDDIHMLPIAFNAMDGQEMSLFAELFERELREKLDDSNVDFDSSEDDIQYFASRSDLEDVQNVFHVVRALDSTLNKLPSLLEKFKEAASKMTDDDYQSIEGHYNHLKAVKETYDKQKKHIRTVNPFAQQK